MGGSGRIRKRARAFRRLAAVAAGLVSLVSVAAAGHRPSAVQAVPMAVSEARVLNANGGREKVSVSFDKPALSSGGAEAVSERYVQYTLVLPKGETRTLTARLGDSAAYPVTLRAVPSGKKNEGLSAGAILLSAEPQPVLSDLGSCATGVEATDGARLVFAVEAAKLPAGAAPLTVILAFD